MWRGGGGGGGGALSISGGGGGGGSTGAAGLTGLLGRRMRLSRFFKSSRLKLDESMDSFSTLMLFS